MVRELKSHRRGPQITVGPYDPNLAPKPPKKWRRWAGGGLALVVLLGAGVWWQHGDGVPPVISQGITNIPPVSATNAVAETLEEAVVPDLPFGMATGLAVGEEAEAAAQYGVVRIVANAPDYAQEYLAKTAKRIRVDTNAWAAVTTLPHTLTNQPCGLVEVALEAYGFKADPASRRVLVQEGRTNDVNFALAPLPAMLTVTCNVISAELEIAGIKSQAEKPVPIPSLKPLGLTVASPGRRTQKIRLGPMNPGKAYTKRVILEREAGALRIEATVPTNAQAYFQGLDKQIRLGSNNWKTVKTLPVLEENLVCEAHPVELQVAGFEVGRGVPAEPLVRDGQTTTVSFALSPLPATLKVTCNVTGAVMQIDQQPSTISNSLSVPSLHPLSVMVSATGYVAQVVKLGPMEPGKTYRQEVKLEPVPVAAAAGQNSLGMEFVEIPGLDCRFSKYETRVKDYAVFAKETNREWPKPDFEQGPDHPAVKVSWDDATAFCEWLTGRERQAGRINTNEVYRLPTDWEWSVAVGLNESKGGTPQSKDAKTPDVYPWGRQWPPPSGAGNYGTPINVAKYENTSPVGSFAGNANGLYDMGGNPWEWCDDFYNGQSGVRVLRGASWYNYGPRGLLSSYRGSNSPGIRNDDLGFRVVLSHSEPPPMPPVAAAAGQNSLGMEFVEIPGLDCRFSKIETRVKDYEVFAKETDREWPKPNFEQGPDHPAVNVSWDDATAFCEWLTVRERQAGRINANEVYRLPADWEWSVAVGLNESRAGTPQSKDEKTPNKYPWGQQWPPPSGAGNYDQSWNVDKYQYTSQVGSFAANVNGLYDMGGNVWEWCEDFYNNGFLGSRVLRGASWGGNDHRVLLSSSRFGLSPGERNGDIGFRCILSRSSSVEAAAVPPASAVPTSEPGKPLTVDLGGGVKLELVWISPGDFMVGLDAGYEREPVHKVTITQPFYMGKYEVTQEQWEKVMGNNPSSFKGPKLPVEQVSWSDCQAFMAKLQEKAPGLDFRLPTDAQWEYACRAGTTTAYHFGDATGLLGEYAWYSGNAGGKTHEVGGLKPNAWGLYDMYGNVSEWCLDWFGSYTSGDVSDPKGASSGPNRVLCGGGWNDYADFCRSAANAGITPNAQLDDIGFRAVATPPRSVM